MSKDLKLKDLVLEHYRMVYETKVDEMTVRVWKPRTMTRKLPTYGMLSELTNRAKDAARAHADNSYYDPGYKPKVQWLLGNPDYGAWDAQLVRRFDPKKMTLDVYFASLLIRPFSKQAYDWYVAHSLVYDPVARLVLMWDSREFDEQHGYDIAYGTYSNMKEFSPYIYNGDKWDCFDPVNDPTFDPLGEVPGTTAPDTVQTDGFMLKYRHKDGKIETETSWPAKKELLEKVEKYLKPTLENILAFTKEQPDVKEIHYHTELTPWESDHVEDNDECTGGCGENAAKVHE